MFCDKFQAISGPGQIKFQSTGFPGFQVPLGTLCDLWPRTCTGVVGLNPTGPMAGMRTLVKPLINCISNQLYSYQN